MAVLLQGNEDLKLIRLLCGMHKSISHLVPCEELSATLS